MLSISNF